MTEYPVTECAACSLPAVKHDVTTGQTHHFDHRKRPCQTTPVQPATSKEGVKAA